LVGFLLLLGLTAAGFGIVAIILGLWLQTRAEGFLSKRCAKIAARRLAAAGYYGTPFVTVARKSGRVTDFSYRPSSLDPPLEPTDHGRQRSGALDSAQVGLPRYIWTDSAIAWLAGLLGCLAAVLLFLSVAF
jgi:hypothetical protein